MPVLKYHNGTAWESVATAGPQGPLGPTGPAGAPGPTGATGVAGVHSHPEYLPLTGGTIAPGPLSLPAPTALMHAARWADNVPRFPDPATRDAAYAALPGGIQVGMRCIVGDLAYTWSGSEWVFFYCAAIAETVPRFLAPYTWLGMNYDSTAALGWPWSPLVSAASGIVVPVSGLYNVSQYLMLGTGPGLVYQVEIVNQSNATMLVNYVHYMPSGVCEEIGEIFIHIPAGGAVTGWIQALGAIGELYWASLTVVGPF